ncbi:YceI family protein [Reichenbachiella sp. MSK19-1]|uniref:YceI family protein n=1 Tax=Reichenbachiella sp. MSK19-1 TaxID=1897631 RepID=UPI000E6D593D|nr:YceI family protein [Reichenbachiella sp. MSK19-1]RJE74145.1 protein yceI precursor [Reichenbachiella sp. MSK19-1]
MSKLILSILGLFLGIQTISSQHTINGIKSSVKFEISNFGFNTVEGTFTGMKGSISFDSKAPSNGSFDVCIEANTVNTDNQKRDEHLRSEDFFYVEKFPVICFRSKKIAKKPEGYLVSGTLTMRGISHEVEIPFGFTDGVFKGALTLDRTDYKVGDDGSIVVGEEVALEIICAVN